MEAVQSLFATTPLVPAVLNTSIAGTSQMLGINFFSTATRGLVTSIRYYRDASEPCRNRTGYLFAGIETLLNEVINETCATPRRGEWITHVVPRPFELLPGGMYTVVVGPFNKYPYTPNFFNVTGYRNGDLSVVPDGTVNGRPSTKPAIPKGTRFKATNFFIDVGFNRTRAPPFSRCNATPPANAVASGAQTIFNSTENVTALSVLATSRTPTPIGVRFKANKAGYILALRWFKHPLEPNNVHIANLYDVRTASFLSFESPPINPECSSGWISQNLPSPLRIEAGQEIVATVFGVTRYPLTLNYFGKTPKVSGDLVATAGVTRRGSGGRFPLAMPTSTISRGGNPWVDVVFSEQGYDCSFYSPDGTGCDDGNPCTLNDKCSGGVCSSGGLNECQTNSVRDVCTYNECSPLTGGCSIVKRREAGFVCNDYDLCTTNDVCNGLGGCFGTTNTTTCPACLGANVATVTTDEGFESGGGGWTLTGSNSPPSPAVVTNQSPRTGVRHLRFEGFIDDETAVSSAYTVTVGTKYMATVWVRGYAFKSIGVIDASNNAILAEVPDINLGDIDRLAIWRKIPVFFTASVASVKIRIFHEASQAEGHVDDVSICEVA